MAKATERSAARLAAVQALYQMDVAGKGIVDALAEFEAHWIGREVDGVEFQPAENAFFRDLLRASWSSSAPSTSASTRRSPRAGPCAASRRCCAPSCGRAPTSSCSARTCRPGWSSPNMST
jgi:hypothetical protein